MTHPTSALRRLLSLRSVAWTNFGLRGCLFLVPLGILTGCQTGDFVYVATIAGGEKLHIPLGKSGVAMVKENGVQILHAGGDVDLTKKQLFYKFALSEENGRELRSVLVEDVSDETAVTLVEDLQPKLAGRRWDGTSRFFDREDPAIKWVFYVADSFRVFRFTITFADGRKVVLHQGSRVPGWAKAAIRSTYGEKY